MSLCYMCLYGAVIPYSCMSLHGGFPGCAPGMHIHGDARADPGLVIGGGANPWVTPIQYIYTFSEKNP